MIALPHGGMLPAAWRRGRSKWSDETIALAREYARDGMGAWRVANALTFHGVLAPVQTIREWLRPRRRTGSAEG